MSTKDKVQNFARNVWLAGLGAYGKGSETLTNKLDKAYEESNQLFNDLVSKGTEIQTSLEAKLNAQNRFENKVDEVREKLGLNENVSEQQIDELTAKVDALTAIVGQLAERRLAEAKALEEAKVAEAKAQAKANVAEAKVEAAEEKPARKTKAASKTSKA